MKKFSAEKVVSDPVYGIIDIRPVLPMVETKEFQALGDKRQLGMAYLTFPSATHSRKAHSLGAYHATRELGDRWVKLGMATRHEADALAAYALYHDIGHPAFSHVTEPFCPLPADAPKGMSANAALSLAVIQRHAREIKACGIDFALVEAFARHKHPLHAAVSDKNFGMEKLDYLERDGLSTILSRPIGIEYLRHHIYFVNGQLAIDEKVIDNAIEAQNFYVKMYKNVYLRKTPMIAQRMVQKMAHRLIAAGALDPADLQNLTDSELIGIMRLSKDPVVQMMYALLAQRDLYREAIVVRPARFVRSAGKDEKKKAFTLGAGEKEIRRLIRAPALHTRRHAALAELEDAIARVAGIPAGHVLVIPINSPERFEAKDIMVYRGRGKAPASLKARYPAHFKDLEEVAEDYLAFRICTTERWRKKLSDPRVAQRALKLVI